MHPSPPPRLKLSTERKLVRVCVLDGYLQRSERRGGQEGFGVFGRSFEFDSVPGSRVAELGLRSRQRKLLDAVMAFCDRILLGLCGIGPAIRQLCARGYQNKMGRSMSGPKTPLERNRSGVAATTQGSESKEAETQERQTARFGD